MRLLARRRDQLIVKEVRATYGDVPVGPKDIVLDLGANIGASGRLFLDKGAGRVIAVEPDPTSLVFARRNLASKRATVIWAAVGPKRGRMRFYPSAAQPYLSSKLPAKGRRAIGVAVVTLEALMAEYRPTVIKCDIEFGEYDLPALYDLPGHVRVLAMELHVRRDLVTGVVQDDDALRAQRREAADLIASFAAQGFTVLRRKDKQAKSGKVDDDTGLGPLVKSIDAIWVR
jgi:FkbM family methyltransferase